MEKQKQRPDFSVVPSENLPSWFKDDDLYRKGGFTCRLCTWNTQKLGFPGRQAMRGHLKRHARDRKAWRRPLLAQVLMLSVAVTAVVAIRLSEPIWIQGVKVQVPEVYALVAAVVVSLPVVLGLAASVAGPTGPRLLVIRAGVLTCSLALAAGVVGAIGVVVTEPDPTWWLLAWAVGGMGLLLGPAAGKKRLALRRRKGPSSTAYVAVHRPVDEDAREELQIWIEEKEQSRRQAARRQARQKERVKKPKRPRNVRRR